MPTDNENKPEDQAPENTSPEQSSQGHEPEQHKSQDQPIPPSPSEEPQTEPPQEETALQADSQAQEGSMLPPESAYDTPSRQLLPLFFSQKDMLLIIITILLVVTVGYIFNSKRDGAEPQTITVIGTASQTINADSATIKAVITSKGTNKVRITQTNIGDVHRIETQLEVLGIKANTITEKRSYNGSLEAILALDPTGPPKYPTGEPTIDPISPATTEMTIPLDKTQVDKVDLIKGVLDDFTQDIYVTYDFKDRAKLEATGKEEALLNAKSQAESIANNSKSKIVKILSIKEVTPDSSALSKSSSLTVSYEVKYEVGPSFLPF